jgi:hypothetical protein
VNDVVGRGEEVVAVESFLERGPRESGPAALVLEGEAGIGKSTLWLAGVDAARRQGMLVLEARPTEAERALAFSGLGDLFEGGVLDEVLPTLAAPRRRALEAALLVRETEGPLDPRALGVAVRNALETLAAARRLLVAVDDLQWLDGSSASALFFAMRRLTSPLHLLLTQRLDDRVEGTALGPSLPAGSVERLHVGPLSAGALQAVVRQRLTRVFSRPTLLRIHELSGGNPFYAVEIARALPSDLDPSRPLPVPETLEELVRARIDALPEPSRQALLLLSALGEADAATLRAASAESALERAVVRGIVERTPGGMRFTHPLLASSVYQSADEAARRSCHSTLAAIVSDRLERTRHLALATPEPDQQVAAVLDDAADSASGHGATSTEVELRRHAVRLTPPDAQDDADRRTIALVRAQHAAGAPQSSLEPVVGDLLRASAPGLPRAHALLLAADLARDLRTTVALRLEAIDQAGDEPALQARIHRDLAWDIRFAEGLEAGERHARACLELADRLGDDALQASSQVALWTIRFHLAKPDAVRRCAEAHESACAVVPPEELAWDTLAFSSILIWAFELERARALLEPLHREWDARDEAVAGQTLWRLACIELLSGHLDAAEVVSVSALELSDV